MTKEDKIVKEYTTLGIIYADPQTDIDLTDGWLNLGYCCNGYDDVKEILEEYYSVNAELGDYRNSDLYGDGWGYWRPKSLRGIESNNGWNKISDVKNPKEEVYYDVYNDGEIIYNVLYKYGQFMEEYGYSEQKYLNYITPSHWRECNEDIPLY